MLYLAGACCLVGLIVRASYGPGRLSTVLMMDSVYLLIVGVGLRQHKPGEELLAWPENFIFATSDAVIGFCISMLVHQLVATHVTGELRSGPAHKSKGQSISVDKATVVESAEPQQLSESYKGHWSTLPESVLADVVHHLSKTELSTMRQVCQEWLLSSGRCITELEAREFHPLQLITHFPHLRILDLGSCSQDVTPVKLRSLCKLTQLSELTLGCSHRTVAAHVTGDCLAELIPCTTVRTLSLAQCVHVGDAGLMALLHMPWLTSLNLSGCVAVTDFGMMLLGQLSSLLVLEVPWCLKLTDAGLRALLALTRLTSLNICGCQLLTEEGLAELAALTSLEKLNATNVGCSKVAVSDMVLRRWAALKQLHTLSVGSVQMSTTKITDNGLEVICAATPKLRSLTLVAADLTNDGISALCNSSSSVLELLSLRNCVGLTTACAPDLAKLTELTELQLLHNPTLNLGTTELMAAIAGLPKLQVLGVRSSQPQPALSTETVQLLSSLRGLHNLAINWLACESSQELAGVLHQLTQLKSLDLQASAQLELMGMEAVGRMAGLTSLNVSRCTELSDAALVHVSSLVQLQVLNAAQCSQLTDAALSMVALATSLTQLVLSHCPHITDQGVAHLGALAALRLLDLAYCPLVTGSGFASFHAMPELASLSLSGCSMSDEGLRRLGRITSLTKLDLCHCQYITDAGTAYLAGMKNLTVLDLAQCALLADGTLAVVAALPNLTTLKLNGCLETSDAGVAQLAGSSSLLSVHLDKCTRLTDASLEHLAHITSLTSLRLARLPEISDAGVQALSTLLQLSSLSLVHCPKVTNAGLMALLPISGLASLEY